MDNDYMETLARAYSARLQNAASGVNPLLDEAKDIAERQIYYIDQLLAGVRQTNRALAYTKSLKQATLRELAALGAGGKVPTYSLPVHDKCRSSFNMLVDLQIDLFITLDRLKEDGIAIENILANELRALGFLGVLR